MSIRKLIAFTLFFLSFVFLPPESSYAAEPKRPKAPKALRVGKPATPTPPPAPPSQTPTPPLSEPTSPLCEAVTGKRCYYIDGVNGSDANDGSFNAPWKTFKKINTYYAPQYAPAGVVALQPGDYVYVKNGVYNQIHHPGDDSGPQGGGSFVVYVRGKRGDASNRFHLVAYPGHRPILDPAGNGVGVYLFQSSWWNVTGLEIRNAYEAGLKIAEVDQVKLDRLTIYDTDGIDNDNMAGLYSVGSTNVEVSNANLYDNYDRQAADTGGVGNDNSTNAVFFVGGNVTVRDSRFSQSLPVDHPKPGACLKYKHASNDPSAYFRVHNNVFTNCKFFAFGSGTANTHFHHNVVVGGHGIYNKDLGGITHQINQIFEYNTFYNMKSVLFLIPTTDWNNPSFPNAPKNIRFTNNIVIDARTSSYGENAVLDIGTYMSDTLFNLVKPELLINNNCYSKPHADLTFSLGGANNGTSSGNLGDFYTYSAWKSLGFDTNSVREAPEFVNAAGGDFRLTSDSPCQGKGAYP